MTNTPENLVQEFMDTFETPTTEEFWGGLIKEEVKEFNEALAHLLKEYSDVLYVVAGLINAVGVERAVKHCKDIGVKAPFFDGCHVLFGSIGEEAFLRVHASNMSKVGDDGRPIRREDGKILKGPNYKPPVLDDLVTS